MAKEKTDEEKGKEKGRKVIAYRYTCTRDCFFEGSRVFAGKSITRPTKLKKEQAAHFRPAVVVYAEETVEDNE